MRIVLRPLLLLVLLMAGSVEAATYNLPQPTFTPCAGAWTSATYTCSGQVSFAAGDIVTAASSITIVAAAGFVLSSNTTIGTVSQTISLTSVYGAISSTGSNVLRGSLISDSGAINLSGMTLTGSIQTSSGAVTLATSSVSGSVTGTGTGSLTSTNVGGNVHFNNGLTVTGGTLSGTASTSGNGSFTNATVLGAVTATNGLTSSNSNFSGAITATNGTSSFTGGTINGDITGSCCKITINGAYVTGNISSVNELEINSSSITGTISNNNSIKFSSSTVYGDVTAAGWSTITGTGSSKVYGTCAPSVTSPTNLCDNTPIATCFTDNFDRSSLGASDWAVTSRNGSFGVPKTVGNRLRLTDNTGNVATAATLQRLLPATGNFVQVQFKYYAYNGNGADGVAVIFSDASVTPQPGGYGGSLGYAQLNGTSGFAGGWAAIALDEYGNFSNPTETRVGGPGLRKDSVSIRGSGSGTTGYPYVAGTVANLNPAVDISGATPGPAHTYRITLDSRTSGSTMVTVERNTGSGFSTLIAPFNIRTGSQATVPSDFFLSLTGSTGGSNNIHELDDLQVCATKINPIGQQIDHFEFVHAGNALTCNPLDVLVRACLDASCATQYSGATTVTLQPSGWVGGDTQTFSGGSKTLQLRTPTASTVVLKAASSTPPLKSLSQALCSSGGALSTNCNVAFADSGFVFDVPTLIAAKPQTNIALRAVKKSDSTKACVPGFANVSRALSFTSAYTSPTTGTQPVIVNGSSVKATPVSLNLAFDSNGSTPLTVRYDDAGQMTLNASYSGTVANGDSGLSMTGSDLFVAKPYGLCLQTDATCTAADTSNNCPVFKAAGDSFPLRINAVGWRADGEALTAAVLCSGHITTPNFQLSAIPLSSQLQAPVGGSNGTLGVSSYSHVLGSQTTISTQSISEVGVFSLTATPAINNYFGETVSGGSSAYLGRIIPAYLSASGTASLTPSCGSAFSYQGQPMAFAVGLEPTLTVTGKNRTGGTTNNYDRGSFWRLATPARDSYLSVTGKTTLDASGRLSKNFTANLTKSGADNGDGAQTYRWNGETLQYSPALAPQSDDQPFTAAVRQGFSAAALTDSDGACYGTGSGCQTFSFDFANIPGSQVRLGRLRLGNAHGSELQGLDLPLSIESWQSVAGGSFQTESADSCTTAAVLGASVFSGYSGNLSTGETSGTLSGPSAGVGMLRLSAPGAGNDGSVLASLSAVPNWLFYDWDATGDVSKRRAAKGLASFGIYKGATPLIFRRELYR